jgi:hypothetical protein
MRDWLGKTRFALPARNALSRTQHRLHSATPAAATAAMFTARAARRAVAVARTVARPRLRPLSTSACRRSDALFVVRVPRAPPRASSLAHAPAYSTATRSTTTRGCAHPPPPPCSHRANAMPDSVRVHAGEHEGRADDHRALPGAVQEGGNNPAAAPRAGAARVDEHLRDELRRAPRRGAAHARLRGRNVLHHVQPVRRLRPYPLLSPR